MAGVNMRLMSKTSLDYSTLGAGGQQMMMVNTAINVTNYKEGTLLLRLHGAPTIGGNAAIKLALVRTAPTEEDPGILFYSVDPMLVAMTIDAATTLPTGAAGMLLAASLPSNFGGYVALAVTGIQDPVGLQTIKATISIDLNLKE